MTNTPVAERVNGAPQDVGQHAAMEQLLRLDNPGGVRWGGVARPPEVASCRAPASQLPSKTQTHNGAFLSGDSLIIPLQTISFA